MMTRIFTGTSRNALLVSSLGIAMSLAGCECGTDGPGLTALKADLELNPQQIDFGQVPVGAVLQLPIAVKNTPSRMPRNGITSENN